MFQRQVVHKKTGGFTLIELLVVVAIIGILAIVILVATSESRRRAQKAEVQSDYAQFAKVVLIAEEEQRKDLIQITGNGWSGGVCVGSSLVNLPPSDPCYVAWQNVLTTVKAAGGNIAGDLSGLSTDPWNSPYLVDENVREGGPNDCRLDTFTSAGPDALYTTSDDIVFNLPQSKKCP